MYLCVVSVVSLPESCSFNCYFSFSFFFFFFFQGQLHIGEIGNRQIALSLQDSFGSITITKHDKGKEIVDEIRYRNQEIEERSYDWLNFG